MTVLASSQAGLGLMTPHSIARVIQLGGSRTRGAVALVSFVAAACVAAALFAASIKPSVVEDIHEYRKPSVAGGGARVQRIQRHASMPPRVRPLKDEGYSCIQATQTCHDICYSEADFSGRRPETSEPHSPGRTSSSKSLSAIPELYSSDGEDEENAQISSLPTQASCNGHRVPLFRYMSTRLEQGRFEEDPHPLLLSARLPGSSDFNVNAASTGMCDSPSGSEYALHSLLFSPEKKKKPARSPPRASTSQRLRPQAAPFSPGRLGLRGSALAFTPRKRLRPDAPPFRPTRKGLRAGAPVFTPGRLGLRAGALPFVPTRKTLRPDAPEFKPLRKRLRPDAREFVPFSKSFEAHVRESISRGKALRSDAPAFVPRKSM